MEKIEPYPLQLRPAYKDYLWGGDRIIRKYGRSEPPGVYAESWEVSDRPEGMAVVVNGPLAGRSLAEVVELWGEDLTAGLVGGRFPLLIKLIDSRRRLSVQVHPDDVSAARLGAEAKTEMWYVLDADPGARVFAGLKPGVDEAVFKRALEKKNFEEILRVVPVAPGDAVYIPGGRVHAIDEGCLLLEVQQNSNTTYRIYDWDRLGPDGKPRPLHIKEALEVINWDDHEDPLVKPSRLAEGADGETWSILRCRYFEVDRRRLEGRRDIPGGCCRVFFVAEGEVRVEWETGGLELRAGMTLLVPEAGAGVRLEPTGAEAGVSATVMEIRPAGRG